MTGRARFLIPGVAAVCLLTGLWLLMAGPRSSNTTSDPTQDRSAGIASFLSSLGQSRTPPLSGPWELELPRDHGAHAGAQSETWSIAAHLEDAAGRPLSVNVVFARLGVADAPTSGPWGPVPAHLAQVVVTAADPGLRGTEQRLSRAAGPAGHDAAAGEIWLDDWTLGYGAEGLDLTLRLGDAPLLLRLEGRKAPLTLAGAEAGGTRGFAIPRLSVTGTLGAEGQALALTGTAWLDRLWGEVPLPGGPLLRDRLVLHLSDGSDLSLLRTRRRDGRSIATVDGVIVAADGAVTSVDDTTVELTPVLSEAGEVPTSWHIVGAGLDLRATLLDNARTAEFGQPARIGQLSVQGTRDGNAVQGAGTLLFTPEGTS
jgi:predicted secreted hydrolase